MFVGVGVLVGVSVGVGVGVGVGVLVGVKVAQLVKPTQMAFAISVHGPQFPAGCWLQKAPLQSQQTVCAPAFTPESSIKTRIAPAKAHREIRSSCNRLERFFLASADGLLSPTFVDLFVDLK